jgi:hypothetical protein
VIQLFKAVFEVASSRSSIRGKFRTWLRENNREHHLVNMYWNQSLPRPRIVVVLSDRETALMLKLAIDHAGG